MGLVAKVIRRLRYESDRFMLPTINRSLPTTGLNIGGGDWRALGFENLDTRHEGTKIIDSSTRFPYGDCSLRFVYSSNFLEHVTDETATHLMREDHRCLKPGGIVRITTPDFSKLLIDYKNGSYESIEDMVGHVRDANWIHHGVEVTPETKLMHAFAGYDTPLPQATPFPEWEYVPDYYCGPPKILSAEISLKAHTLSVAEFSEWATGLEREKIVASLGHINWFDGPKLCRIMQSAGFANVRVSEARQSSIRRLRGSKFDRSNTWSCFAEAIK